MQDPADTTRLILVEDAADISRCSPEQSDDTQAVYPCWKLVSDTTRCWIRGQLISFVLNPSERSDPLGPAGTNIGIECWACTEPIPGLLPASGCNY
jgi:hypothetical protein